MDIGFPLAKLNINNEKSGTKCSIFQKCLIYDYPLFEYIRCERLHLAGERSVLDLKFRMVHCIGI